MLKIIQDAIKDGFEPKNIIYFSFDEFKGVEIREIIKEYEVIAEKDFRKGNYMLLLDEIQKLADWDPFTIPIITEKSGFAAYRDLVGGVSLREITDEATGLSNKVITDWKLQARGADLLPRVTLLNDKGEIQMLANGFG